MEFSIFLLRRNNHFYYSTKPNYMAVDQESMRKRERNNTTIPSTQITPTPNLSSVLQLFNLRRIAERELSMNSVNMEAHGKDKKLRLFKAHPPTHHSKLQKFTYACPSKQPKKWLRPHIPFIFWLFFIPDDCKLAHIQTIPNFLTKFHHILNSGENDKSTPHALYTQHTR